MSTITKCQTAIRRMLSTAKQRLLLSILRFMLYRWGVLLIDDPLFVAIARIVIVQQYSYTALPLRFINVKKGTRKYVLCILQSGEIFNLGRVSIGFKDIGLRRYDYTALMLDYEVRRLFSYRPHKFCDLKQDLFNEVLYRHSSNDLTL